MRRFLACAAAILACAGGASAADDTPAPPSYSKDIKPLLSTYCMNCHSDSRPRAGVAVETFADLTAPGRRGVLVTAGKPDDSRLLAVMTGRGRHMPPGRSPQPKADEIAKIRDWITAGAVDDTQPAKPADPDKPAPADAVKP